MGVSEKMVNVGQLRRENVITFLVSGDLDFAEDRPETFIQLSLRNAADLLRWLGFDADEFGYLDASDLRARCMRRLWPIPRNFDPAVPERHETSRQPNVHLVIPGREAGYLRARTEELLKLADRALAMGELPEAGPPGILYS